MKLDLYVDPVSPNKNNYVWVDKNTKCYECQNIIENILFIHFYKRLRREETQFKVYCSHCSHKIKHNYDLSQLIYAIIDTKIRKGYVPVLEMPFSLGGSANVSSGFDALHLKSEQTNDQTKYALRGESFKGATIGADMSEKIKELDQPLEDIDSFLLEMKNSTPLIEEKKTKQIEDKKDKE